MGQDELLAALDPYLCQVQIRRGGVLSRGMNQSLRSYPMIPEIIQRTAALIIRMEQLFGFTGEVRMSRVELFGHLLETEHDWVHEVPAMAAGGFVRVPDRRYFSLPAFQAAMTIGYRVGLFTGRGKAGLSPKVLERLRRIHDQRTVAALGGGGHEG